MDDESNPVPQPIVAGVKFLKKGLPGGKVLAQAELCNIASSHSQKTT
jgi:hypothetical protein